MTDSEISTKPAYIREQHNTNCQQFFGQVTGCVFAMPGANVTQQPGMQSTPSTSAPQTQPQKPRKRKTPTLTAHSMTEARAAAKERCLTAFVTHGVLDANLHILCQQMVKDGWIAAETSPDDFAALFHGGRTESAIVWKGKYGKSTLVYLFRHMEFEGLLSTPRGHSLPNILMGHFTDTKGRFLTHLDKGDAPADKAATEVLEYIRIMSCNPTRHLRTADDTFASDDDLPATMGTYDPYDHTDLHLHNKRGFGR